MIVARATLLTAACLLVGVAFNTLRPHGIDLVAAREYEIFVPCPETQAEAETITATDLPGDHQVVYVDARPVDEYQATRIKQATSFPYPLLGEPPQDQVDALKRVGKPIVVYGNGGRGDLGRMMANLLTELGVPQVSHLEGGLPAWRAQGGTVESDQDQTDCNCRKQP